MLDITDNGRSRTSLISDRNTLRSTVESVVAETPVIDIHTHLFAPEFGAMNLCGIDELLTYHYLVAELFRSAPIAPAAFWKLSKSDKADLVWRKLFVENTPLSEATLGVITVLSSLGLEPNAPNLDGYRDFFRSKSVSELTDLVMTRSNVSRIVMTNDPFDVEETAVWDRSDVLDPRFAAALRLDRLLNAWETTAAAQNWDKTLGQASIASARMFLDSWIFKMKPLYLAVSLPDDFDYRADDARNRLIREVVLPTARNHDLPFALMVGVRRGVNPELRSAGDGVGRADVGSLEKMCLENPSVRFLATYLSRENQHELCVAARKFSNLTPFGCWWFLNNPSIIREITRERLELLGTTFIPQHSDARVLDQLLYKWKHSREVVASALLESYERLFAAGKSLSRTTIEADVKKLFSGNFENLTNRHRTPMNGSNGREYN